MSSARTTASPLRKMVRLLVQLLNSTLDLRFQVPIDVAVKEPRTGVVGSEAESDYGLDLFSLNVKLLCNTRVLTIVSSRTNGHNIAAGWVDIVVIRLACAPDDVEDVTMQVERMRETTGERDLDGGVVSGQRVDRPVGKKLGGARGTTKNLKEDRDGGWNELDSLEVKEARLI